MFRKFVLALAASLAFVLAQGAHADHASFPVEEVVIGALAGAVIVGALHDDGPRRHRRHRHGHRHDHGHGHGYWGRRDHYPRLHRSHGHRHGHHRHHRHHRPHRRHDRGHGGYWRGYRHGHYW